MAVARQLLDVELVSVDSMQVYRDMDIGTAKPTADDQRQVPHHLLDLVEPTAEFTVAEFQRAYVGVLTDITERRCRALLVGGTGLYHRAVIDEFTMPGEWPEIRARLEAEAVQSGSARLYARLIELDPAAASRMESSNMRRVVRALEVCEGSGRPFSSFGPGVDNYPDSPVTQIGLRWDRGVQATRIEQRVHAMMQSGLLEEVTRLARRGLSKTAAQALGYKEMIAYLDGDVSLEQAVGQVIVRTRQFAVRQERWFRRDPRVRWIDIEHDPVAEVALAVIEAFENRP
jgi:tRNA dimethylallyltransferase